MMKLGAYTFVRNPDDKVPVVTEERRASYVKTLGGIGFFSWGDFLPGQEISLSFSLMPTAQYAQFLTFLKADAELVWDNESGSTYNVEILSLNGQYNVKISSSNYKNVELKLLIMSKV
jgi:hypothetical protein